MNMAEQFRLSASFRDMKFPNPLTPFALFSFPFLSVFFLGIMPFSIPLSFIFLSFFILFSAGSPNPLIPFACGKRTESLSGRTWLLCLFVYCFSFGCLFFRKFSKPFRLLAGWRIRLCLLQDDGLIRRASGGRKTDG